MKRILAFIDYMLAVDHTYQHIDQTATYFEDVVCKIIELDVIVPIKNEIAISNDPKQKEELEKQLGLFEKAIKAKSKFKKLFLHMCNKYGRFGGDKDAQLEMAEDVVGLLYIKFRDYLLERTGMKRFPIQPDWQIFISLLTIYLKNRVIDWVGKYKVVERSKPLTKKQEITNINDVLTVLYDDMKKALGEKYKKMFEVINNDARFYAKEKSPFSKAFRKLTKTDEDSIENFGMNKADATKTFLEMIDVLQRFFSKQESEHPEINERLWDIAGRIVSSDQREMVIRQRIAMWVSGALKDCIADRITDSLLLKFS